MDDKKNNAFQVLMRFDKPKKRKDVTQEDIVCNNQTVEKSANHCHTVKKTKKDDKVVEDSSRDISCEIIHIDSDDNIDNDNGNEICSKRSMDDNLWKKHSSKKEQFPTISHVQQKSIDTSNYWTLPKLFDKVDRKQLKVDNDKHLSQTVINFDGIIFHYNDIPLKASPLSDEQTIMQLTRDQVSEFVGQIKKENPTNFTVNKFYKSVLRKKINFQEKQMHRDLWPDVFKPQCFGDLFCNRRHVISLEKWLQSWLVFNTNPAKLKITNQRRVRKSKKGDDFIVDDDELKKEAKRRKNNLNNYKVIIGPCGSSKTATLYALCEQYDIKILEWNASSFRTGKNLVRKFDEATKSHLINNSKMMTFFEPTKHSNHDTDQKCSKSEKMSLILIKDFDIIFEDYDEGFLQALNTLISTSKRPIVLITSSNDIVHLENQSVFKFLDNNDEHFYQFERSKPDRLRAYFQILLLVTQRVYLDNNFCNVLISVLNRDIRRLFLQLQFWFNETTQRTQYLSTILKNLLNEFDLEQNWWKFRNQFENMKIDQFEDNGKNVNNRTLMANIRNDCEFYSFSDVWLKKSSTLSSNSLLNFNDTCYRNDMSLNSNFEMYDSISESVSDVVEFLWSRSWSYSVTDFEYVSSMQQRAMDERKRILASEMFQKALPECRNGNDCDSRTLLDYLPYLREINRLEHDRCQRLSRDKKRYRNYLKKFHIHVDDSHNQDLLQFNLSSFQNIFSS